MPTIDDMFPPSPREHFEKAALTLQQVVCNVQFAECSNSKINSLLDFKTQLNRHFRFMRKAKS